MAVVMLDRLGAAATAVQAYMRGRYSEKTEGITDEAIHDLLCDLRHLALWRGLDVDLLWANAKSCADDELAEEVDDG